MSGVPLAREYTTERWLREKGTLSLSASTKYCRISGRIVSKMYLGCSYIYIYIYNICVFVHFWGLRGKGGGIFSFKFKYYIYIYILRWRVSFLGLVHIHVRACVCIGRTQQTNVFDGPTKAFVRRVIEGISSAGGGRAYGTVCVCEKNMSDGWGSICTNVEHGGWLLSTLHTYNVYESVPLVVSTNHDLRDHSKGDTLYKLIISSIAAARYYCRAIHIIS